MVRHGGTSRLSRTQSLDLQSRQHEILLWQCHPPRCVANANRHEQVEFRLSVETRRTSWVSKPRSPIVTAVRRDKLLAVDIATHREILKPYLLRMREFGNLFKVFKGPASVLVEPLGSFGTHPVSIK